MTKVRIIRATPQHCEVLSALHRTSFSKPWSKESFAALLEQPGVAAWISKDNEPSGFILLRSVGDESEILTLAVAPNYRRAGLGTLILKTAFDALQASGAKTMFLEVSVENPKACGLYRKFGFSPKGTRPAYSSNKNTRAAADAIIMTKTL